MPIKTTEVALPAHWASALISNEWSGLQRFDRIQLIAWQASNGNLRPVSCDDHSHLAYFNGGFMTEMLNYQFHVIEPIPYTVESLEDENPCA